MDGVATWQMLVLLVSVFIGGLGAMWFLSSQHQSLKKEIKSEMAALLQALRDDFCQDLHETKDAVNELRDKFEDMLLMSSKSTTRRRRRARTAAAKAKSVR